MIEEINYCPTCRFASSSCQAEYAKLKIMHQWTNEHQAAGGTFDDRTGRIVNPKSSCPIWEEKDGFVYRDGKRMT